MQVWLNGNFIDAEQTSIPIDDRGLLLGHGVFDTALYQNGKIIWAEEHFQRLLNHATIFGIAPISLTLDTWRQAISALLQTTDRTSSVIRTTITAGQGPRGLSMTAHLTPNILISAAPAPTKGAPLSLIISNIRRNEGSPLSQIKSINYGDNILAKIDADKKGADDALLLNNSEHICCTTIGNIFFIKANGDIITPPINDGVMNGVTREKVIGQFGAQEVTIHSKDFQKFKGCFATNSICSITPITRIDSTVFDLSIVQEMTKGFRLGTE